MLRQKGNGKEQLHRNIEIKARVADREAMRAAIERISDGGCEVIQQRDVFFRAAAGRLKLRILSEAQGELIYYERPDARSARLSRYLITPTTDPNDLEALLSAALGVVGTVNKTRTLYTVGQTRVHLDQVDGLGDFLEIEVVLDRHQAEKYGHDIAAELMQRLGIARRDLVDCAYIDLVVQPDQNPTSS